MELSGRVVLITGGRRVGAVVATELARSGADVALVYRRSAREAEHTAAAVRALGRRAAVVQGDLQDADACQRVVDQTVDALGRVDVLVNMASVYRRVSFDDLTPADWDAQLNTDLRAAWLCARAAVPHMRRLGGGRIVNISDWTAASARPR
jgi:NAD(P)-dependent dehydrogenase (short-subunit alcohol dehydrogenase family)